MPKGVKNYFYYKVHCDPHRDLPNEKNKKIVTALFRTAKEAGEYIGVSKATVFNMLADPSACRIKDYYIERCEPPVSMYDIVEVGNIIIS